MLVAVWRSSALYRLSKIFERDRIDLDRSTLADWVGRPQHCWALADAIGRHVLAGQAFADDAHRAAGVPGM
ncbi:MAG: hypothetical protein R3D28_14475 [Geminicoccaceae bacterium]